jgi:formiminoglutamase
MTDWLSVTPGRAPLIVSIPHAGTIIPGEVSGLVSPDLARRDADHHVERLYAFASDLGATLIQSRISRTVIDLNRDPSGQSLYPGQETTGLCPIATFDGHALYAAGAEPDAVEISRRRATWFSPYHAALQQQIDRVRDLYPVIVLYDAHSIRSRVPRLFAGELPTFNIGSFDGASCDGALTAAVAAHCSGQSSVINGRFKGGWITRHYGRPGAGVHAVQMELAMRAYLDEAGDWPPAWDETRAAALQTTLRRILSTCLDFAKERS